LNNITCGFTSICKIYSTYISHIIIFDDAYQVFNHISEDGSDDELQTPKEVSTADVVAEAKKEVEMPSSMETINPISEGVPVDGVNAYTGKIARKLDPSLVVAALDTDEDGTISKHAITKQTPDPMEKADVIRETVKAERRDPNAKEKKDIKKLEEEAKIKQEEDNVR